MGNSLAEKKRDKQQCVGIEKKLDEEEKRYFSTVKILIMGQGTVNFLNALQCIRDNGIDEDIAKHCVAYIYHQMIFEMKSQIKKSLEKNVNFVWSSKLYRHCVTDSLLIYGFIKQLMLFDRASREYSFINRRVVWNVSDSLNGTISAALPRNHHKTRIHISCAIMSTIIAYYQSHETVQHWLDILFLNRSANKSSSSVINHYILNNVDIASFIADLFNELHSEQRTKLLTHYDLGVAHYFSNLERICSATFYPEAKDIILMSRSIGFSPRRMSYYKGNTKNELKDLEFRSSLYHFTNIQPMFRTAVKRWIYQFEDHCDALIFLIPLTTYYKWDSKWDTFNLILNLQTITNNNWLKKCSFHLFLTGKDLFRDTLKTRAFNFTNYAGDKTSYQQCTDFLITYLKSKLIADNKGDKRQIYIHVVSLYDLPQLEASFAEVCSVLQQDSGTKQANHTAHHEQISSQKFEL